MASVRQIAAIALFAALSASPSPAASDRPDRSLESKSASGGALSSPDSSDPMKDWMSREHTYYERQGDPEILW